MAHVNNEVACLAVNVNNNLVNNMAHPLQCHVPPSLQPAVFFMVMVFFFLMAAAVRNLDVNLQKGTGWWGLITAALGFYAGAMLLMECICELMRSSVDWVAPRLLGCCVSTLCFVKSPLEAWSVQNWCCATTHPHVFNPLTAAAAAFLIEDMWGKEVLPLLYTKAYKQHAAHLFPRISSSDPRSVTAGVPYPGRPEFKRGDNLEAAAAPSLDNLNRLHSGEAAV